MGPRVIETGAKVRLVELEDTSEVEALWTDLERRAEPSFFQSWGWIHAWLNTFPERAGLMFLQVWLDGRIVGLSLLGRNVVPAGRFFTSRALLVSEAGDPDHDALTVEHSGILMERGLEALVLEHALAHLRDIGWSWDELFISGVEHTDADIYKAAAEMVGLVPEVRVEHPYFYVDLEAMRGAGLSYLDTLSRNTRYQVRRSMRRYAERGELTLRAADTVADAHAVLTALQSVHQACWNARGEPGAFATPRILEFHRQLIETCLPRGQVELLEVRAGATAIGYLYNFVLDGVVSNYQTGFVYEDDPHLKPGLVSHALAVERATGQGRLVYDFLMGDQRYKRSMAKHEASMQWLVLRNQSVRTTLQSRLRDAWHWLTRAKPSD